MLIAEKKFLIIQLLSVLKDDIRPRPHLFDDVQSKGNEIGAGPSLLRM